MTQIGNQLAALSHQYNQQASHYRLSVAMGCAYIKPAWAVSMVEDSGLYDQQLGSWRPKEFACRYCGTTREDKAHNCRNCAGLEVV